MGDVTAAWIRIENWLRQHSPGGLAALAFPADEARIAAAGVELPAELAESLRRHDGLTRWNNLLPWGAPLAVAEIVEHYEIRMEIAEDVDGFTAHQPGAEPWWHERWIPFADAGMGLQIVDGRDGRVGLAPTSNPADFADGWPSLSDYLHAVVESLETGTPIGEWHPYLTVAGDLWWDLADRTELDGQPLRPVQPTQATAGLDGGSLV
ncbi:SMI1/KNR4 family protein [Actinoplanes derwentensis]|uniref:Knr4/Smi1-like domain-containing protein n=1 Tax=Actinoplanes derwentensis TaxID=113562 RepID=A0A1H2AT11_9ACTN|nr:SMI1/KNR4 family protein [Actinoplanes derwentensis]GID84359.1 hypothetical protein Ade03nite_32830 [Actinoplanes derwentensis]SDT48676.1 hypothetical protein SAMN04489716_4050 [Actinoplanes derwentensis]